MGFHFQLAGSWLKSEKVRWRLKRRNDRPPTALRLLRVRGEGSPKSNRLQTTFGLPAPSSHTVTGNSELKETTAQLQPSLENLALPQPIECLIRASKIPFSTLMRPPYRWHRRRSTFRNPPLVPRLWFRSKRAVVANAAAQALYWITGEPMLMLTASLFRMTITH
jgi:hypothetical protein